MQSKQYTTFKILEATNTADTTIFKETISVLKNYLYKSSSQFIKNNFDKS